MYALIATVSVRRSASAPSDEALSSAVSKVRTPAGIVEHVTIVRRPEEILVVMYVTAPGVEPAAEVARLVVAAVEASSDAVRVTSVRLRRPEDS